MNAWIYLILAGVLETMWALGMKYSEGFTKLWPSLFTLTALLASMVLLAWSVRTLPIGTAYPVWVGIGAAGTAIYGMAFLAEPASLLRILFLAMLMASIIGLKWTSH